jgi:photosystem II stability/assembly factor-like uncharacterized protein
LQAWFLDANHGYITGLKGLVQETSDGGKTWAKLEASGQAPDALTLNYDIVSFRGAHGIIIGASDASSPILSEPGSVFKGNGKVTVLETLDSGKKWTYGTLPIDGELAQLKMSEKGYVVTLILYTNPRYAVSSAVFETPLGNAAGHMVFAERDRYATDIALLNNGGAILASVEPPGNSNLVPIPGKLKILKSDDLKVWREMDVDYRAVAQRAIIAAPDPQHVWVATDTGAILGLVE